MLILIIALLVLVVFIGLGLYLLDMSCGRKHHETDYWDPKQLEEHGYGELKEVVLEGRDWFLAQEREDVECMSYDFKCLHGILLPNENARGTMILFHGWHSSYKLDFMSSVKLYYMLGFNLLIVEQRAHGESEGRYLSYGVKESRDVASWVTYAATLFGDEHPIFLGGVSMGASTVLMAADTELDGNVRGIIADCGFTSPYDIIECVVKADYKYLPAKPILAYIDLFARIFAGFSLKEKSTLTAVSKAKYPILFFHGKADGFVPYSMTVDAYNACISEKEIMLVPGARHGLSFIVEPEKYIEKISNFVDKYMEA